MATGLIGMAFPGRWERPVPLDYEIEEVADEDLFTRTGRWRRAVGIALAGLQREGAREGHPNPTSPRS